MTNLLIKWLDLDADIRLRVAVAAPEAERGLIVLAQGRTEFIEKYRETIDHFVEIGFCVVTFDWRGQGLSTRDPIAGQRGFISDFSEYLSDLDAVLKHVVTPLAQGRNVVHVAHSMGGHVMLRHLIERAGPVRALILSAPMVDIRFMEGMAWFRDLTASSFTALGKGRHYVVGGRDYDPGSDAFAPNNNLTSDPLRYQITPDCVSANPALATGSVTWGWLAAAGRSIRLLKQAGGVEAIASPVFMGTAGADAIVSVRAQDAVAGRSQRISQESYEGAKHELFMERDEIRERFLADVTSFLTINDL